MGLYARPLSGRSTENAGGERDTKREQRKTHQIQSDYEFFEKNYGKQAASRAQAMAERFVDVVVGTTAHNLGGVITSLKMKADSLAKAAAGDLSDAAQMVQERVAFLERLVKDMQDYSRSLSRERRRERLSDLVTEANRYAVESVTANNLMVENVQFASDVPRTITVHCDTEF